MLGLVADRHDQEGRSGHDLSDELHAFDPSYHGLSSRSG